MRLRFWKQPVEPTVYYYAGSEATVHLSVFKKFQAKSPQSYKTPSFRLPSEKPGSEKSSHVKLAVAHQVCVFYTGHVLFCGTASFCNDICDYVCGGSNNLNITHKQVAEYNMRPPKKIIPSGCLRRRCQADDRGEFLNIDICHQSVWFCSKSAFKLSCNVVINSFDKDAEY